LVVVNANFSINSENGITCSNDLPLFGGDFSILNLYLEGESIDDFDAFLFYGHFVVLLENSESLFIFFCWVENDVNKLIKSVLFGNIREKKFHIFHREVVLVLIELREQMHKVSKFEEFSLLEELLDEIVSYLLADGDTNVTRKNFGLVVYFLSI
jgi:hypothetical protein